MNFRVNYFGHFIFVFWPFVVNRKTSNSHLFSFLFYSGRMVQGRQTFADRPPLPHVPRLRHRHPRHLVLLRRRQRRLRVQGHQQARLRLHQVFSQVLREVRTHPDPSGSRGNEDAHDGADPASGVDEDEVLHSGVCQPEHGSSFHGPNHQHREHEGRRKCSLWSKVSIKD